MSSEDFIVTEHQSPCSFIREWPHGVKDEDVVMHLAVKEYRPRHSEKAPEDAITIIAAHGNGFPKETYEPLFTSLLHASKTSNFSIHSIWIADTAHQSASYALNADNLGDDPNWFDHSRDLFLMINRFRSRMKAPFVGVAHSMGCAQIVNLSLMHPRLFTSLVLIEPVIQAKGPPGPNSALGPSKRREVWGSREEAEAQMKKNPFFRGFDKGALELYLKFALRDLEGGKVALATPKAQEAWSYLRPNFTELPPVEDQSTREARERERLISPDFVPFSDVSKVVFPRPETIPIVEALPRLRPRVMWLYGECSHMNKAGDDVRNIHLNVTGSGRGGSGGAAEGAVETSIVKKSSHLCCFERPGAIAKDVGVYLGKEIERWRKEKHFFDTYDSGKSKNNRTELSDKWMEAVKLGADVKRTVSKGGSKL